MSVLHLASAGASILIAALFWLASRVLDNRLDRMLLHVCSVGYVAASVLWIVV